MGSYGSRLDPWAEWDFNKRLNSAKFRASNYIARSAVADVVPLAYCHINASLEFWKCLAVGAAQF